jgi:hypothetical protein
VGPLFSRMASSECTPTSSSSPSWRACSMAPAWPVKCGEHVRGAVLFRSDKHTVVGEVEAAVDPDALL